MKAISFHTDTLSVLHYVKRYGGDSDSDVKGFRKDPVFTDILEKNLMLFKTYTPKISLHTIHSRLHTAFRLSVPKYRIVSLTF